MKKLGIHSERNSQGCYYRLVEMTPEESQRTISDIIHQEEECNECNEEMELPF